MTLDDFPGKPSAAHFGDCVGHTLALRKDHPTEADVLLHLLPRMLLGRLSQERFGGGAARARRVWRVYGAPRAGEKERVRRRARTYCARRSGS